MLDLFQAVLTDVVVYSACAMALAYYGRLRFSHPATTYLVFHGVVITWRGSALLAGAPRLFSWPGALAVSDAEISRALLYADLALVLMTCAWIWSAHRDSRIVTPVRQSIEMRPEIVNPVAVMCILIGGIATVLWSKLPGIAPYEIKGDWASSSWLVTLQVWIGLGVVALIYLYGFKPLLVVLIGLYLAVSAYQGAYRFRLLITGLLLLEIYLDRRGRRWPRFVGLAALLSLALLFYPLKQVGSRLQVGDPVSAVAKSAGDEIATVMRGEHPDQSLLDQFASTITLGDRHGLFWGRTYVGLLTIAIPRQWWPNKPGLADYLREISTRARPMGESGMVTLLLGDLYLNFGLAGMLLLSFVFAWLLSRCYQEAYRRDYYSVARFAYLLIACNLIMVFRDGLGSLFVFPVVHMMPLTAIIVLHLIPREKRNSTPAALPLLRTPRVRARRSEETLA